MFRISVWILKNQEKDYYDPVITYTSVSNYQWTALFFVSFGSLYGVWVHKILMKKT